MIRLSKDRIDSFCGNVLPLWLVSDQDISRENIVWEATGDSVAIRSFADGKDLISGGEDPFNSGVLLTLLSAGTSKVSALYNGTKYECCVNVREAKKASEKDRLNYYKGDLHIHSTEDHKRPSALVRTTEMPSDVIEQISREGELDFSVITDHDAMLNNALFFRGFVDDEEVRHDNLVVFPGCENGCLGTEIDRYGYKRKHYGEIISLNADSFATAKSLDQFLDMYSTSPFAVGILVHPQAIGWDDCGIWDSVDKKDVSPRFLSFVKLIEMGNGEVREDSMFYECIYSAALDLGFHVSPCCSSDSHAFYEPCPGKTFIMAPEKSKEAFLDALWNCRVYACESGKVRLAYSVNGRRAPVTLSPAAQFYDFHVEIGLFEDDETAMPVRCEVISDYGLTVKTVEVPGEKGTLDFTVASDSARYFFLRLMDAEGRKTWSMPVWTGREFDSLKEEELTPLDKSAFTAFDEVSKKSADAVVNDRPGENYETEQTTASIVIDMQREYAVSGIGHMAPSCLRSEIRKLQVPVDKYAAGFVNAFKVSTSCDGKEYRECREGLIRYYGREAIFAFETVKARYIKFDVLNTVGKASGRKEYAGEGVKIGELSVFAKKEGI